MILNTFVFCGSGIGIVNAIEVVNAFDGEGGLKKFKEMVESVDLSLLKGFKRKGSQSKAKGNKGGASDAVEEEASELTGNGDVSGDPESTLRQEAFMENHVRRKCLKKLTLF